jgi:hypothetical protein
MELYRVAATMAGPGTASSTVHIYLHIIFAGSINNDDADNNKNNNNSYQSQLITLV